MADPYDRPLREQLMPEHSGTLLDASSPVPQNVCKGESRQRLRGKRAFGPGDGGDEGVVKVLCLIFLALFRILFLSGAYLKPSMESCACRPGKPSGASTSSKLAPE